MTNTYFIVGATGAIGYGLTKAIQEAGKTATLLVRDRRSAVKLFGDISGLTFVEGDVYDTEFIAAMAKGHRYIFHGANASYEHWAKAQPAMTQSVINAAARTGATVIFPGNNYNYGPMDQPISEVTPFNPTTNLGKVRVEIEQMLQSAANQGQVKALVVRLAELWGPNVTNKQFAPVFEKALGNKALPWLISAKAPQQLLYNMDAGRAIVALTQLDERPSYDVVNIGGELAPSVEHWLKKVADIAGAKPKISVAPKAMVKLLGRFIPVMREVASMSYKYEMTITLNDEKFRTLCPDFKLTSMDYAIDETLQWFRQFGTDSKESRANRRKARASAIWAFAVDNVAIGLFPVAIGFAATQIPVIQNAAIYLAVAAGIYWTPGLHKLANSVKPRWFNVT